MWSTQDAFKETIRDSAEEYRYAASLSVNDHTERIQVRLIIMIIISKQ
jgi:hypothetical protein